MCDCLWRVMPDLRILGITFMMYRLWALFYDSGFNCLSMAVAGFILAVVIRQRASFTKKLKHMPDYQQQADASDNPK